jgi:A/G-specific adenine glycosylase
VVDGNVSRVIARLYGVDEPVNRPSGANQIDLLAQELMDNDRGDSGWGSREKAMQVHEPSGAFDPGNHNQAMMEFGALQCTPVSPRCEECPLASHCNAKLTGRVERIPVKVRGRKPVDRWCYFFIIISGGETILEKRDNKDIWGSLYQFPMVEHDVAQTREQVLEEMKGIFTGGTLTVTGFSEPIRHQLSHRTIHAHFIHAGVSSINPGLPSTWIVVPVQRVEKYPVPRLIHRYLESVKI